MESVLHSGNSLKLVLAEGFVDPGNRMMATPIDVALNKEFIKAKMGSQMTVSWREVPLEKGAYRIDRVDRRLFPISEDDRRSMKLEWHEVLYIEDSAVEEAMLRDPLILCIGEGSKATLTLKGRKGSDESAMIAQFIRCRSVNGKTIPQDLIQKSKEEINGILRELGPEKLHNVMELLRKL